jgi:hypothetical protein
VFPLTAYIRLGRIDIQDDGGDVAPDGCPERLRGSISPR